MITKAPRLLATKVGVSAVGYSGADGIDPKSPTNSLDSSLKSILYNPVAKPAKKEDLSFEEGMEKLENLVEKMESAQLPLEEIIQSYEEGMKLLQFCGEKLKAAEVKIELLTRDKSGTVTRSELPDTVGAEGFSEEKAVSKSPADEDEVSLF